jgi:hypothetical protein
MPKGNPARWQCFFSNCRKALWRKPKANPRKTAKFALQKKKLRTKSLPRCSQRNKAARLQELPRQRSVLPDDFATVFYAAIIALALVRCDERISRSGDEVLRVGMQLTLSRPWIDGRLAELLLEVVRQLEEPVSSDTEG